MKKNKLSMSMKSIALSVDNLNKILDYFGYTHDNTIIQLVCSKEIVEKDSKLKDKIIGYKTNKFNQSVFLKKVVMDDLYYFLANNKVLYIYLYKANSDFNVDTPYDRVGKSINDGLIDALIYLKLDTINVFYNKNMYDVLKTKKFLKKFKTSKSEIVMIIIAVIIGIICGLFL